MKQQESIKIAQNATSSDVKKQYLKWAISILIPILVYILPQALTHDIRIFFAITLWAVFMWVFELIPEATVGIMLPVLYVLAKIGEPKAVFSGWSSGIPWVTIGGFLIGLALVKTGLAKRLAYKILTITGTSLIGIIAGVSIAIFIINPLVPSIAGKVALFTPLVIGIIQALEIKPGSKASAAILLATFFAVWAPAMCFATGGADVVLVRGIYAQNYDLNISWVEWFKHMFVPGFAWFLVSILTVFLIRPEKVNVGKNIIKEKSKELGSINKDEKVLAILITTLLVLFATDSYHGISSEWVMVIVSSLLFFPGVNLLEKKDLSKINYPLIFFMVGSMAIGVVSNATGATKYFIDSVLPILSESSNLVVLVITWVFALIVNMLVTPLAALSSFTIPIAEVYSSLGILPQVSSYVMLLGLNNFIFPYEVAPFLIVYGYGYIKLNDFFKIMLVRIIASLVLLLAVIYPYWKLIGII